jgi:hypothetical protein
LVPAVSCVSVGPIGCEILGALGVLACGFQRRPAACFALRFPLWPLALDPSFLFSAFRIFAVPVPFQREYSASKSWSSGSVIRPKMSARRGTGQTNLHYFTGRGAGVPTTSANGAASYPSKRTDVRDPGAVSGCARLKIQG